ncbi:hypothetical protein D9M69_633850 [compost metagenome]
MVPETQSSCASFSSSGHASGIWLRNLLRTWALVLASLRYLTSRLAGASLRKLLTVAGDSAIFRSSRSLAKLMCVVSPLNFTFSQKRVR